MFTLLACHHIVDLLHFKKKAKKRKKKKILASVFNAGARFGLNRVFLRQVMGLKYERGPETALRCASPFTITHIIDIII